MKNLTFYTRSFAFLCIMAFTVADHSIVGHWVSKGPDNSKIYLDFNPDNTFKVTVDGRMENAGNYQFMNDTFYMYDKNCGLNVVGKYKINFVNEDSASFKLIQDSCSDRAGEVNGGIIKRLKAE